MLARESGANEFSLESFHCNLWRFPCRFQTQSVWTPTLFNDGKNLALPNPRFSRRIWSLFRSTKWLGTSTGEWRWGQFISFSEGRGLNTPFYHLDFQGRFGLASSRQSDRKGINFRRRSEKVGGRSAGEGFGCEQQEIGIEAFFFTEELLLLLKLYFTLIKSCVAIKSKMCAWNV